ncbi:putative retrotransposon gag domain-containing protein [Helianthus annuus]|nr:putative retrotransposon gag domain-containing protein [Helianthus annuus]
MGGKKKKKKKKRTLRWLEKTEAVIAISKCAEEDQVMYASNLFKEGVLEWWNTILQAKGRRIAYAMSWEEFKNLVERKFCPEYEKDQMANKFPSHHMTGVDCRGYTSTFFEYARVVPTLASPEPVLISRYIWGLISEIRNIVKAARPRTIDDAVELANTLTDELVRTREEDHRKELAQKITQGFRAGNTKKRNIMDNAIKFAIFARQEDTVKKTAGRKQEFVITAEKGDIFNPNVLS